MIAVMPFAPPAPPIAVSSPVALLGDIGLLATLSALMAVAYLLVGAWTDLSSWRRRRQLGRVSQHLATIVFADEEQAEVAVERVVGLPDRVLLPVLQRLAADLDGDADDRLRRLVRATGTARSIARRADSRRWRRRAQAASLSPLLPDDDPRRLALLRDPHPVVRARAAENLDRADISEAAPRLLAMLDDPVDAVRFAAQHALLQGDGRIVGALVHYLANAEGPGVVWALEVAAAMTDPRLQPIIERHVHSDQPVRRAMAARSLVAGAGQIDLVAALLDDVDADVRIAATHAAGSPGGEVLAARIGTLLGDRSWKVRREAGRTLAVMGPTGALVLRSHLVDADPYARDMARRTLDDIDARGGRSVIPAPVPVGIDPFPARSVA